MHIPQHVFEKVVTAVVRKQVCSVVNETASPARPLSSVTHQFHTRSSLAHCTQLIIQDVTQRISTDALQEPLRQGEHGHCSQVCQPMREERHETVRRMQGSSVLLACVSARALVKRRAQGSMQGGAGPSFRDGRWSGRRQQSRTQDRNGQHECVHHLP